MPWFKAEEECDMSIITCGETEEKALEELNRYSDDHLVHSGEATKIMQIDDGSYAVKGFFNVR